MAPTTIQQSHPAAQRLGWQVAAALMAAAGAIWLLVSLSSSYVGTATISADDTALMEEDWGEIGQLPQWLQAAPPSMGPDSVPPVVLEPGQRLAVPEGQRVEVREIPSFPLDNTLVTQHEGWVTNRSEVPVEIRVYRP